MGGPRRVTSDGLEMQFQVSAALNNLPKAEIDRLWDSMGIFQSAGIQCTLKLIVA